MMVKRKNGQTLIWITRERVVLCGKLFSRTSKVWEDFPTVSIFWDHELRPNSTLSLRKQGPSNETPNLQPFFLQLCVSARVPPRRQSQNLPQLPRTLWTGLESLFLTVCGRLKPASGRVCSWLQTWPAFRFESTGVETSYGGSRRNSSSWSLGLPDLPPQRQGSEHSCSLMWLPYLRPSSFTDPPPPPPQLVPPHYFSGPHVSNFVRRENLKRQAD